MCQECHLENCKLNFEQFDLVALAKEAISTFAGGEAPLIEFDAPQHCSLMLITFEWNKYSLISFQMQSNYGQKKAIKLEVKERLNHVSSLFLIKELEFQ